MITLDAVIPVLDNVQLTAGILHNIMQCEVKPRKLYVIDNGSKDPTESTCRTFQKDMPCMEYVRFDTNIGVNAAWNYVFERSDADHIWVLNNDLILNNRFFQKTLDTFAAFPDCQMAQPLQVFSPDGVHVELPGPKVADPGNEMVGWAFTVSKKLRDAATPIPKSFFIYCGDQWLFDIAKEEKMQILLMQHNRIFHYGSVTCNKTNAFGYFYQDLAEFQRLTKERCTAKGVALPYNQVPWE